jgi:hypothetical protein
VARALRRLAQTPQFSAGSGDASVEKHMALCYRSPRGGGVADEALCEAIGRAERDLVDADLGGCLIKQRVARPGQGRRGGFRTIIAYRAGDRSVFLYGFAKSAMANMSAADERDLQDYGGMLLALDGRGIRAMIEDDELTEVACDDKG